MRYLAISLWVSALAGCDKLLGLGNVGVPPADVGSVVDTTRDAGPLSCATMTPAAFYCAEYDEAKLVKYVEGVSTDLTAATAGVVVTAHAPAISPPNALWVESTTAAFTDELVGSLNVSRLHASFDLNIEHAPSYAFETVMIGIHGQDPHACQAFAQIASQLPALRLMTICGGVRTYASALPAIPTGWVSIDLDLDIPNARASMAVNHQQQPASIDLTAFQPIVGPADVRSGVLYVQGSDGGKLAIDDLVVTVSP